MRSIAPSLVVTVTLVCGPQGALASQRSEDRALRPPRQAASQAKGVTRAPKTNLSTIWDFLVLKDHEIDLAKVKLTLDRMIDPGVDVASTLTRLDAMSDQVKALFGANAPPLEKLLALRKYIYEPGPWNRGKAFGYDFEDPFGDNIRNKLLSTYLDTKKGNCVSMPFLFIILGQKLGLDVTASLAPNHLFVKYRHATGMWLNLETTNGASFARDAWIRSQMPMTDKAVESGIYLQPLTKHETVVAMTSTLIEFYERQGWYEDQIMLSQLGVAYHPRNVLLLVNIGSANARRWDHECVAQYRGLSPAQLPEPERQRCMEFHENADFWLDEAAALGWRPVTRATNAAYRERVAKARAEAEQP